MANSDTPHKKLQCFSCLTTDGNERIFKYESRKWLSDDFDTKLQKLCDRKFRIQKYVPESPFHNVQFSRMEVDMRRVIFRLTNCLRQDIDPEDVEEEIVSIDEQIVV